MHNKTKSGTLAASLQQTVKPQHENKAKQVWEEATEEEPAAQPWQKQSGTDSYLTTAGGHPSTLAPPNVLAFISKWGSFRFSHNCLLSSLWCLYPAVNTSAWIWQLLCEGPPGFALKRVVCAQKRLWLAETFCFAKDSRPWLSRSQKQTLGWDRLCLWGVSAGYCRTICREFEDWLGS